MSNVTLSELVVRNTDGSVDLDGSCDKFRGALQTFIAATADLNTEISTAVNAVFDEHKGARMAVPTLVNFALGKMNVGIADWSARTKQVHDYVSSSKSLYDIRKGKGGGVCRISDLPAPATTDSK